MIWPNARRPSRLRQDTETAKADAAYSIQQQIQRKDIERETAEANIVKQEQEALVKEQEVKVRRQALEAEIKAQAVRTLCPKNKGLKEQTSSSAKKKLMQKPMSGPNWAQADKEAMLAEAEGIRAKGEAEAVAIAAKLLAEAEGLEKKAEAMAKMNQAAVLEMYFNALPDVARAIAEPLTKIDSITMYGEGNSAKMVEDITKSMTQVQSGLNDSVGLDVKQLINTMVGIKTEEAVPS